MGQFQSKSFGLNTRRLQKLKKVMFDTHFPRPGKTDPNISQVHRSQVPQLTFKKIPIKVGWGTSEQVHSQGIEIHQKNLLQAAFKGA